MNSIKRAAVSVVALMMLGGGGCDLLQSGGLSSSELAPTLETGELGLRHGPSLSMLGSYYCSDLFGTTACSLAFGATPTKSELTFEFGMPLTISNPNNFPVPALSVLVGLKLFEGDATEGLGAICLTLCGDDDPSCDGRGQDDACHASDEDIRSIDDFVDRIPGLIDDIVTGQALDDLRQNTILARGDLQFDLSFTLGVDQALQVLAKVAEPFVNNLLKGADATLDIPVSSEGSFWVRLPLLGRLGIGYGPVKGVWEVL